VHKSTQIPFWHFPPLHTAFSALLVMTQVPREQTLETWHSDIAGQFTPTHRSCSFTTKHFMFMAAQFPKAADTIFSTSATLLPAMEAGFVSGHPIECM